MLSPLCFEGFGTWQLEFVHVNGSPYDAFPSFGAPEVEHGDSAVVERQLSASLQSVKYSC